MSQIHNVRLQRQIPEWRTDPFVIMYSWITQASAALDFPNYSAFITSIFCDDEERVLERWPGCLDQSVSPCSCDELRSEHLCFTGTAAYEQLRKATDLFIACQAALLQKCGFCGTKGVDSRRADPAAGAPAQEGKTKETLAAGVKAETPTTKDELEQLVNCYTVRELSKRFEVGDITFEQIKLIHELFQEPGRAAECCQDTDKAGKQQTKPDRVVRAKEFLKALISKRGVFKELSDEELDKIVQMWDLELAPLLTFMHQLRDNLRGIPLKACGIASGDCTGVLLCKLQCPPMLELIWSYWMEQGMLVQGLNAVSLRFQNRRLGDRDPLSRFDITPLRPLNNWLWGYIQNEPDRLSVVRRAYEYDHHYGLRLNGRAVPALQAADSRTRFLDAFHRLLREAARFYRLSSDTTLNADAFPLLNSLKELHLLLAEGMHNQFGDLPTTARAEMLVQQWLLARPEMRDFLGGRPSVPYPAAWMPHMDTLRQFYGWADTSIRNYRDLAVYGEELLLSVRWLPWSTVNSGSVAAIWAAFWRPEIQSYIHSYREVTGVDLGTEDVRLTEGGLITTQPSDLILRRRAALTRAGA